MRRWTVLWVVLISSALFFALLWYNHTTSPRWDPECDHASFRTNEWGTKALRELLVRCGRQVDSWEQKWSRLPRQAGVLWVIDPQWAASEEDVRALLDWVAAGGTCIIAPDPRPEHRSIQGLAIEAPVRGARSGPRGARVDHTLVAQLGWSMVEVPPTGVQKPDTKVTVAPGVAVGADVSEVEAPARWRFRRGVDRQKWSKLMDRLGVEKDTSSVPPEAVITLDATALVEDAGGIVLAVAEHGRGTVALLCDADILSNSTIAKADNVVLATNLAYLDPTGPVWFDEYQHGRRIADENDLDTSAFHNALMALVIALCIYVAGASWRFGTPIPMDPPPRRSALEYVWAFATLYQRAGKRSAALGMIAHRFRVRLGAAGGLPLTADPGSVARAVVRRYPNLEEAELLGLLERLREIDASGTEISEIELVRLTRGIWRIEQEFKHHER